jgi:hypothetical protein
MPSATTVGGEHELRVGVDDHDLLGGRGRHGSLDLTGRAVMVT